MAISAIVFTDQPSANNYATAINTRLGYPLPGVDMGPGNHAPAAQSRTLIYGQVFQHPTLALWAYINDGVISGLISKVPVPGSGSIQVLDSSWGLG